MSRSNTYQCRQCGATFELPAAVVARYPGWTPPLCRSCRSATGSKTGHAAARRQRDNAATPISLSPEAVLERFSAGPTSGIFTDGSASPNPGPGGWGVVYVVDNEIIDSSHGRAPHTTNNRMELTALIQGYSMASASVPVDIYSDSQLCVKTINEWASAWEARGWRRKGGPIQNLDLVQELYALAKTRPHLRLRWIRGHAGARWNEYADALASSSNR